MRRLLFLIAVSVIHAAEVFALEGRVSLPDGSPAAGAQVAIIGMSGSVRADGDGRFVIADPATVPFTVIVVGARGEIYPAVTIESIRAREEVWIRLQSALSESMVVASVAPNIEALPASATSMIGREGLEERRPEHLVDALSRIAGVQARGEGHPAVPVIRGLTGGRTLILLDDTRVTAERRAGPSATFLDPFSLSAIEVTRGPGSVAYGSDAIGGVIHARPRDPRPGQSTLQVSASSSFAGQETHSAGIEVTQDVGSGALLLVVHGRNGDGSTAPGGARILNSSFRDHGGALRFLQPASAGVFRAAVTMNRATGVGAPSADAAVNPTVYPDEESRRLTMSFDAEPKYGFHDIELRAGYGSYDITTNRGLTTLSSSTVTANDLSLRAAASRVIQRGRIRGGIDYNERFNLHARGFVGSVRETSIEDARKSDAGAFLMSDFGFGDRVMISAGGRLDRVNVRNRGGFFGDRSRNDTAFSGYAGLSFTPVAEWTATIQAARGYRDPALSDRYFRGISGRGFVAGNPDLEPETTRQFDASVRWQRGRQSLSLFGYHYRIRDLVERYRAATDFHFRNRGEAEVKGVEIEATTPLPYKLSLHVAAAVARGEVLDDDAALDDIAMPNAHVALQWNLARTVTFLDASFYARDTRPGPVETSRPGYSNLDLGLSYRLSQQIALRVVVRNVTNVRHAASADANAALASGRSVVIGVDGSFRGR